MITISIIVPCYNEEEIILNFIDELEKTTKSTNYRFELIFIDNRSLDSTWEKLFSAKEKFAKVKLIQFSNYFGKEAAILSGIDECTGDAAIIMDPDLEDPPELIPELIQKWKDGAEIVLTYRSSEDISKTKKILKGIFYKLLIYCSERVQKLPQHSGDFRILDRKVVNYLKSMREKTRFLRGLVNYIGFKQEIISFDRPFRQKGHSKSSYNFLYKYALDSLFSFSNVPISLIIKFGFGLLFFIIIFTIYLIFQKILGNPLGGFTTVLLLIGLTSSFNIIAIGLVGEYVSRIYTEVKNRPPYIISKNIDI